MISRASPCSLIGFGVSKKCLAMAVVQRAIPCILAFASSNWSCGAVSPASSWKWSGSSRNKVGSSCIGGDLSIDACFFCLGLFTLAPCLDWTLRAIYCCCSSSVTRRNMRPGLDAAAFKVAHGLLLFKACCT